MATSSCVSLFLLAVLSFSLLLDATVASGSIGGGAEAAGLMLGRLSGSDEVIGSENTPKRRMLETISFISYGALEANRVPCDQKGCSYYNCSPGQEANPYSRGCSIITQCSRY